MGRPYREELAELRANPALQLAGVVDAMADAFRAASAEGLVVVASGGALVVAEWACDLFRHISGRSAVAMTPLQFSELPRPVLSAVWLLSAGGRHPDILMAACRARERGDRAVGAVIGRRDSALAQLFDPRTAGPIIEAGLEVADGFLATYSVWHMSCLLAEAAGACDPTLPAPECAQAFEWGLAHATHAQANDSTCIIVHDAWTALGAFDLETRVTETALTEGWRTDWRNLGHGRHFWLASRAASSRILALSTPRSAPMAHATLAALPANVEVTHIAVPWDACTGALAALAWSIATVAHWGEQLGRDPGRPGVPEFGERLYTGGFPYPETRGVPRRIAVLARKSAERAALEASLDIVETRLREVAVRGIVFDFDGTLVDTLDRFKPIDSRVAKQLNRLLESGIAMGVATGRGDSAQSVLQEAINQERWAAVIVGYHNGRIVQSLAEDTMTLDNTPTDAVLSRAREALESRFGHSARAELRARPGQLTLIALHGTPLTAVWREAHETLAQAEMALDIWMSSHSVDIVPKGSGKTRVVDALSKAAGTSPDAVVRIGDRGAWPGNDWQMLSHPLGLSVEECSADLDTCWNLLPAGLYGIRGTCWLLERLIVTDGVGSFELQDAPK